MFEAKVFVKNSNNNKLESTFTLFLFPLFDKPYEDNRYTTGQFRKIQIRCPNPEEPRQKQNPSSLNYLLVQRRWSIYFKCCKVFQLIIEKLQR